jgi:RND superfamily putative drug exporter
MYGAGTDYCLFLISRFREEMANDLSVEKATKHTVRMVGETISSSAGTIFVGFVSMTFAEMGMFRSAGPMLAMGIAISLFAGLTLAPALLATLGNRAFWPGKASHRSAGRFYELTSKMVSSRPLITILIIVIIMAPFSVYGLTRDLEYDFLSELPDDLESVQAYNLIHEHMGAGNLFPLTVIVTERDPDAIAAEIGYLSSELNALDGVVDVRGLNSPLGIYNRQMNNLLRVDGQLMLLVNMAASEEEGTQVDPQQAMAMVAGMRRYVDLLAERFPEMADDENLMMAREIVGSGPEGIATRQLELMASVAGLIERFRGIEDAYLMPSTGEGDLFAMLRPLVENYVTANGSTYRLEVVLEDPLSEAAMDTVRDIRGLLEVNTGNGDAVVNGATAVYTDIQDVMARDQVRVFGFILAGIFLVLLLMLRSVVAPMYLIGTVVLSFTCTLGLTNLFFDLVYDVEKLSWMLPVFMFVFLVALGIDYSIFLFGRIKEEVGYHGIREGVHVAVAATGAIITSAGVILAGTFAGMMAGEMMFLAELGFAVSVGVLIDTFVVRTILDPALATLFGRWTWWPGGVPKAQEARPTATVAAVEAGD